MSVNFFPKRFVTIHPFAYLKATLNQVLPELFYGKYFQNFQQKNRSGYLFLTCSPLLSPNAFPVPIIQQRCRNDPLNRTNKKLCNFEEDTTQTTTTILFTCSSAFHRDVRHCPLLLSTFLFHRKDLLFQRQWCGGSRVTEKTKFCF